MEYFKHKMLLDGVAGGYGRERAELGFFFNLKVESEEVCEQRQS